MTSIFTSFDSMKTLASNLEKLGVTKEVFSKAVIQSIGEMDTMMTAFIKRETVIENIKSCLMDDEDEAEEEESGESEVEDASRYCVRCKYRFGYTSAHPNNPKCLFSDSDGNDYRWLNQNLYLMNGIWLVLVLSTESRWTVGKMTSGTGQFALSGNYYNKVDRLVGAEAREMPFRSIHALDKIPKPDRKFLTELRGL